MDLIKARRCAILRGINIYKINKSIKSITFFLTMNVMTIGFIDANAMENINYNNCFEAHVLNTDKVSSNVVEKYIILHLDKNGSELLFEITKERNIRYISVMFQSKEIARLTIRSAITSGNIAVPDNSAEKLSLSDGASVLTVCGIQ